MRNQCGTSDSDSENLGSNPSSPASLSRYGCTEILQTRAEQMRKIGLTAVINSSQAFSMSYELTRIFLGT
jgi:hypothetical protein